MKATKLDSYRQQLEAIISRIGADVISMEDVTLAPAGGQANGELSNAPLHLADSGTDAFHQEMNSLLLENEQFLIDEALDALQRFNEGTFGHCVGCGELISEERLDAIPYARRCVACAEQSDAGQKLNLNAGRPVSETETIAAPEKMITRNERSLDQLPFHDNDQQSQGLMDRHAAGTPGGGTAMGGLAGTNRGHGGPEGVQLEDAMGSGLMDNDIDDESSDIAESNRSGSAIRGTPAGKRAGNGPRSARRK